MTYESIVTKPPMMIYIDVIFARSVVPSPSIKNMKFVTMSVGCKACTVHCKACLILIYKALNGKKKLVLT